MGNADVLSRHPLPVTPAEDKILGDVFLLEKAYPALMSPAATARPTGRDRVLVVLREKWTTGQYLPASEEWRPFLSRREEFSVQDSCLLWGSQVVEPGSLHLAVFLLHESHPRIEEMKMVARSQVW